MITADPDSANGNGGWYTSVPSVSAASSTSGATITYATQELGGTKSAYSSTPPTLGQGTTEVFAKATSATCARVSESTRTFMVDTNAPDVNPADVVDNTWRNSPLSQAFTSTDSVSGLADANDASFTLTASDESADADNPTEVTRIVSDVAGNSTTRSVSAKIDLTNPTIEGSRIPGANSAGWNNANVAVNFTCADGLSGIASCGPNTTLSTEGADQSVTGTAIDNAGNSADAAVSGISIDMTKPVVSVTGVSNGATYTTGNVPTPGCDTHDQQGLSGVKTNATVNVTGGNNGFGTLTATCSGAEDNADNSQDGPVSVTYSVKAAFDGFLQPIDGHSVNTGKYGRTYPIKWQLRDSSGALISDSAAQLLVANMTGGQKSVSCGSFTLEPEDALEASTTGGTSLRYDATSDQFIYNYKAPSSGSCYVFAIRSADGLTTQQIDFKFTK